MSIKLDYVLNYLSYNNFNIDKNEFLFQLESHPDFPSLLSISDTLKFLNIDNGVFDLSKEYIDDLPNNFIVLLSQKNEVASFFHLRKKSAQDFLIWDKKKEVISRNELEDRWSGLVLIAESKSPNHASKNNSFFFRHFSETIILSLLFLLSVFSFNHWTSGLFMVLASVGTALSFATYKEIFEFNVPFIDNWCSSNSSMDCTNLVKSKKWKIFEYIEFRDLSLSFFLSQLIGLFLFEFHSIEYLFFKIQLIFLVASLPLLLISLGYQKFIAKQWCLICLSIIALLFVEGILVFQTIGFSLNMENILRYLIIHSLLLGIVFFAWSIIKRILIKSGQQHSAILENNRVVRDFDIFSKTLYASQRYKLPDESLCIMNNPGKTELAIVTNPFCSHCANAHNILHSVYENFPKEVHINLLMNVTLAKLDSERKSLVRSLLHIFRKQGNDNFMIALKEWYDSNNLSVWLKKYKINFTESEILKLDEILEKQSKWCKNNELFMTPIFFLDGYKYPGKYNRDLIPIFLPNLVDSNSRP